MAWVDVGNVTSVTRTEGSNGATYTYRVRAVNSVGPSPQVGAAQSVTTWDTPGVPNVNASGGDHRINASWSQPASNGGTAFTGHQSKLLTGGDCQGTGTVHNNPGSPDAWGGSRRRHHLPGVRALRERRRLGQLGHGDSPHRSAGARGDRIVGPVGARPARVRHRRLQVPERTGTGFNPGQSYQAYCQGNHTGSWQTFSNTYTLTANSSGVVTLGEHLLLRLHRHAGTRRHRWGHVQRDHQLRSAMESQHLNSQQLNSQRPNRPKHGTEPAQMVEQQQVDAFAQWFGILVRNVGTVIKGKDDQIALALVCLFAEGHLLVEDKPGTGKTSLAKSIANSFAGDWSRIQFTPDLLPSDVTGGLVYHQGTGDFRFVPGPVFSNVVLADEINRASPKTQSALLEAMEERQVTTGNGDAQAATARSS